MVTSHQVKEHDASVSSGHPNVFCLLLNCNCLNPLTTYVEMVTLENMTFLDKFVRVIM